MQRSRVSRSGRPASARARHVPAQALAILALLAGLAPMGTAAAGTGPEAAPARTGATVGEHAGGAGVEHGGDHADYGHPVAPVDVLLEQPDGTSFTARPWGNGARTGYETPAGYSVVQQDGQWVYADGIEPDGQLSPGTRPADDPPATAQRKHLRPTSDDGPSYEPSPATGPSTGTQRSLLVLAQFTDRPSVGSSPAQWSDRFFGATGSVRDFYRQSSYGAFDLAPARETSGATDDGVVGWVTIGANHPNPGRSNPTVTQALARSAMEAAGPFVDFASYDTDGNGRVSPEELHVTVILAGYETSYGGESAQCGPSVWAHRTALSSAAVLDGKAVGSGGYTMFGEWHCTTSDTPGHLATIGVMAHELGHDLGWPDLYDTDGSSEGIGTWSLMAAGSWGRAAGQFPGASPTMPDAFSRYYQGWVTPTAYTAGATGVPVATAATTPDVKLLGTNPGGVDWSFRTRSGTGEYFLVENRQRTGLDVGLPGCGLLVWHVDEGAASGSSANATDGRRLVDLLEADGLDHLDKRTNRGDAGDPFPGSSGRSVVDATTHPSTLSYAGTDSGASVRVTSASCASTMTMDLGTGSAPVEPDADGDGVPDGVDVCRDVPDPAQLDEDGDGAGDLCDDVIDVSSSSAAYPYVKALIGAGVTVGCSSPGQPLRYCPAGDVTRQQMAIFLLRAMGVTRDGSDLPPYLGSFADVPDNYAARYVEELARRGITVGCAPAPPGGRPSFCPEPVPGSATNTGLVTREQMAVFLLRAAGITQDGAGLPPYEGTFDDVPDNFYARYVEELARHGITNGCAAATSTAKAQFCPGARVNRQAMAIFLVRTFGLPLPG